MSSEQINLTFGIELEFVCVHPKGVFDNQEFDLLPLNEEDEGFNGSEYVTAGQALKYYLEKAGIPAAGWEKSDTVETDEAPYSKWSVKEETVDLNEAEWEWVPDDYYWEPIEISSPILYETGDDWVGEIRNVLAVMDTMKARFHCDFLTNASTGFHVHIGNAGGEPMPFEISKRVLQLSTALERVIDSMHASSRVLAPPHNSYDHAWLLYGPLSSFHHKHNHLASTQQTTVFDWLARIEGMNNYDDMHDFNAVKLGAQPCSGHSCVVHMDNLRYDDDEATQTIEFRQHGGTLDYIEICSWVTFLTTMVRFCNDSGDVSFVELLLRATDMRFTATELARAIGCPQHVIDHYDFDSEPEIIGMLPQPADAAMFTAHPDLNGLAEQNDSDAAENSDRTKLNAKITFKAFSGYYGFNPASGLLPLDQAIIFDILTRAADRVCVRAQADNIQLPSANIKAIALRITYKILGDLHRTFDPAQGRAGLMAAISNCFTRY